MHCKDQRPANHFWVPRVKSRLDPISRPHFHEGETVWEGVVEVFSLKDHPKAKRCYAWLYEVNDSKKRRFFAVLHEGPVKSARDAVRAVIAKEFRNKQGKSS